MITILMATYQGEKYIREQLDSILAQTERNWRLVIWDDGSQDGTVQIAEEYAARYPEKITVRQNAENLGSTKNFLSMLMTYESEYFMFADQDDIWHEDKLAQTKYRMRQMEKRYGKETPALVCTDAAVVDREANPLQPSFTRVQHFDMRCRSLPHLLMENLCIGCTMMLNQALADKIKVLPEHARFHDWWVALVAAAFGHISYLPLATLDYRQHGKNVVGTQSFGDYVKNRLLDGKAMKEALKATFAQAEEFYEIYGAHPDLDGEHLTELEGFLRLQRMDMISKRFYWLCGGYFKSGLIRNLGLFITL